MQGLAVSAAATVAVTVVASVTLLPALLASPGIERRAHPLAGPHRRRLRRRGVGRRRARGNTAADRSAVGRCHARRSGSSFLRCGVRWTTGHPSPVGKPRPTGGAASSSTAPGRRRSSAAAVLVFLAIPVVTLRLAFSDESNFAEDTTTRQAYDLAGRRFRRRLQRPAVPRRRARPRHRYRRAGRGHRGRAGRPGGGVHLRADPDDPDGTPGRPLDSSRPRKVRRRRRPTDAGPPPSRRRPPARRGTRPAPRSRSPAIVAANIDFSRCP